LLFNTIEGYNKELWDMKQEMEETAEYLKKHPNSHGTKGNYETLTYLYKLYSQDKIDFISDVNDFNLKLEGNHVILTIHAFDELNKRVKYATNSSMTFLEPDAHQEELYIKSLFGEPYKITYAFENPTEEDVKRTSPRKKGLMKIFDFINCGDDIEKLKKEAGPNGTEALKAYRDFLKEIIQLDTDFTLDTEMGTVKACLTLQQSKNICENLTFN
jgi:hypothetical protein